MTVEVDELDPALEKARSLGGSIVVEKQQVPGVGWLAYLNDPDGNVLGVLEPVRGEG